MTNFAPVGPLSILRYLPVDTLGNYHLLIAPKVLEHPNEYARFFSPDDDFVIMDNGVIELGYPLDIRDLWRAAQLVSANVVVLPDTIDDAKMTVKQARQNVPAYRTLDQDTSLMGVVQGTTFEECIECATGLVEAGVNWLGVPRGLTPNLGSRVALVVSLGNRFDLPMHVLGFSENIADDVQAATAHKRAVGMDAATPLWYGMDPHWAILPPEPPLVAGYGRRPVEYWSGVGRSSGASFEADRNVLRVRRWLSDAQLVRIEKVVPVGQPDQPTLDLS